MQRYFNISLNVVNRLYQRYNNVNIKKLNDRAIRHSRRLKGHSHLRDGAVLDTSFSHFEKSLLQPEIKVHLEIRFIFRSVLLDFQSFTEKPVFECAFAHSVILFYHIWLKTVWIVSLLYAN